MYLGAAVMSLFTGAIADAIGRKTFMLLLVFPSTIGWCLLIWANSAAMLYCGRIITGMVTGAFTVLSVMYTMEIAQKEIRGALGSSIQLMITIGIFYSNSLPMLLDYKLFTTCCAVIPLLFAVLFSPMPETPLYLLKKNNFEKAHSALQQLRGENYDVEKELLDMQSSLEELLDSEGNAVLRSLRKGSTRKACLIGFGLMLFKTICGFDALTTYSVYIFSNANVGLSPNICVIILISCQLVVAVFQSLVVDRFGRKVLLCISGTVMTICLIVVAVTFLLKDRQIISEEYYKYVNILPLVALILYCVAFALGLGPIPWLIMGEIFPLEIKSIASSIGTFILWITGFLVTKLFILVNSKWGNDAVFFIFALFTCASVVFVIVLVPETKKQIAERNSK